ncbi:MAG: hypothetical protein ACI4AB_01065 [Acetatifactor sp.]
MKDRRVSAIFFILIIGSFLIGTIIVATGHKSEISTHDCCGIPVGADKLNWGMTVEEIIEVLGEPISISEEDSGETLVYNISLPSELGTCSQVVLSVGKSDLTDSSGKKVSSGLCNIIMSIDNTTKEDVLDALSNYYGDLSSDGGSTQMELSLKEANADYFNEWHFCDEWRVGNLSDEEYRQLKEFYNRNREGMQLDAGDPLVGMVISGVEEGEAYTCKVQLNAMVLVYLQNIKE